ncbi:MAG: bifunctional 4-hydroxy-3-methylbut-2-enyl diphosphate reductase/30S ribosomal protein S1 [Oscillospiraceae bacterium]|nr:bifunctional 4-hydroxy-3-methylbut-2-enyl diphosphate reductase/30S ribosomal protein S1 [Oscillospiraceae bacterium]
MNKVFSTINVSKRIGYCFGVERAIDIVYKLLDEGKKVATFGRIVHNSFLNEKLLNKGVLVVSSFSELKNNTVIVIRAHGAKKDFINKIVKKNIEYKDATCPFVKKIHSIVADINENGIILIAGDKTHPEVEGIISYCNCKNFTFKNGEELKLLLSKLNFEEEDLEIFVVAQTTFSLEEWEKCLIIFKKELKKVKIFNTICVETKKRQLETVKISSLSDIMLIIGDPSSSNTIKLKKISQRHCKTYLLESKDQINSIKLKKWQKIGVVAGASTPKEIVKEVLRTMSRVLNDEGSQNEDQIGEEQDFREMLEESFKDFDLSSKKNISGVVEKITPQEVYVNLGRKQTGVIPISELTSDLSKEAKDVVSVGDKLNLKIIKVNDQEGTIILSKKRADYDESWSKMLNAKEENKILSGTVIEVVKGGIIADSDGTRVFIPGSQATASRDDVLENLLQKEVFFKITEVDRSKRKIVGSIKSVIRDERRKLQEEFWKTAQVGKKYKGKVKTIKEYGAFVDIGNIDGMLHVSELSWNRVGHPSEVLKVNDEIEVYIKSLDQKANKIALGYKKAENNPWEIVKNKYKPGDVVDVEIVGFTDFGAFAKVIDGVDGLIHISQISKSRINSPQDVLKLGQIVKVVIREIDAQRRRLSLSINALDEI